MTRWLILALLLLLPVVGLAQPTPKVYWEHDGLNITNFRCVIDPSTTNTTSLLGLLTPDSGTTYSTAITNCHGLAVDGAHILVIQACNGDTCTNAVAITVVKL